MERYNRPLKNIKGFKDFETGDEFLKWVQTFDRETIKGKEIDLLDYHNPKYLEFYGSKGWTFDNFKKFWAYVNEAEYYEDVRDKTLDLKPTEQVKAEVVNKGMQGISVLVKNGSLKTSNPEKLEKTHDEIEELLNRKENQWKQRSKKNI
ncbi:MAG: hypothetical protein Nk1A_6860 [Endomicrobiia bacterium]|nr:MAG: hypothetical protein Nk1A_6860 [Endomicrobiia bacterium]